MPENCPECGTPLIRQDGCEMCPICGYSACEVLYGAEEHDSRTIEEPSSVQK